MWAIDGGTVARALRHVCGSYGMCQPSAQLPPSAVPLARGSWPVTTVGCSCGCRSHRQSPPASTSASECIYGLWCSSAPATLAHLAHASQQPMRPPHSTNQYVLRSFGMFTIFCGRGVGEGGCGWAVSAVEGGRASAAWWESRHSRKRQARAAQKGEARGKRREGRGQLRGAMTY